MNLIQFAGNVWHELLNVARAYRFTGCVLIKLDLGVWDKKHFLFQHELEVASVQIF